MTEQKPLQADRLTVYCDGGIGGARRASGLGVVIRDQQNEIIGLAKRGMGAMTNNEAEYAALVLALKTVRRFNPRQLHIFMDSEVVVGQMEGRFAVNSPALRRWHMQACHLARQFPQVRYTCIPRDSNRLADALATEALREMEAKSRKRR